MYGGGGAGVEAEPEPGVTNCGCSGLNKISLSALGCAGMETPGTGLEFLQCCWPCPESSPCPRDTQVTAGSASRGGSSRTAPCLVPPQHKKFQIPTGNYFYIWPHYSPPRVTSLLLLLPLLSSCAVQAGNRQEISRKTGGKKAGKRQENWEETGRKTGTRVSSLHSTGDECRKQHKCQQFLSHCRRGEGN